MQLSGNAPVTLSPAKEASVPTGQETEWDLSERKNLLSVPEIKRFLGFPARSLVTIPAELHMFQYNVYCSHKISM